ncbi:YpoC family protein [Heyndrickxia ginsengihumi]|uniref:YpoC-like domain-containing protein n=1 Tax=Heyndrickxia ginsengihumi TaxID=363870 RepID=A0A6M0P9M0_9BACI|nr:hypothetical protein [Heyndrickxia ginsengihumi]MCM3022952.1 hypothetical protein [Heyndrickxia ginsengihumi]NEY20620.1 hypothetical protein [Heyndrickxia ginsengihumi]
MEVMIPQSLQHPLFFSSSTIAVNFESKSLSARGYFPYEIQYEHHLSKETPWVKEHEEAYLSQYITYWQQLYHVLYQRFQKREKNVQHELIEGIAIFLSLLFWSNHKRVVLQDLSTEIAALETVPVNIEERLHYILQRPTSFSSFMQLTELIQEQQKHRARKLTIEKIKDQ